MKMNKRGAIFFGVVIGFFLFAMGVLFMPFLEEDITTFRSNMECSSSSIGYGTMALCLLGDGLMPYFIWFFTSMSIGLIGGSRI